MTDDATAATGAFSTRTGLALIAVGAALFMALLWMIGTGNGFGDTDNGGGHGGGKGLNGFAGLARLVGSAGWNVALARNDAAAASPGVLVLTPAADTAGKDIGRIVDRHRQHGPVIVIAPKWLATPVNPRSPAGRRGWVDLAGVELPNWPGFLDHVGARQWHSAHGGVLHWRGTGLADGLAGRLPDGRAVEAGNGTDDAGRPLIPLVRIGNAGSPAPGPVLAATLADNRPYPLVLVFEPDLLDNYGLSDPANAALALRLFDRLSPGGARDVVFDLTLAGLGTRPNLLTLAFSPPYLGATMCLILAALAAGWRSFCRFGAARAAIREMPFGKTPLVANSGALILRARRLHLLGDPFIAASRDRIARALALPRLADIARTDAAIDRALTARSKSAGQPPSGFAQAAQTLHQARGQAAIVAAAQALHAHERILTR